MKKSFTASIISLSLIISAIIINADGLKHLNDKNTNDNIIQIEDGTVRLGRVDSERELIDLTVYLGKEKSVYFDMPNSTIKELGLTPPTYVIHLKNTAPSEFKHNALKQLNEFLTEINANISPDKKITAERLISPNGFAIKIQSKIIYNSTIQGDFPLTIEDKDVTIENNALLLPSLSKIIDESITEIKKAHKEQSFM